MIFERWLHRHFPIPRPAHLLHPLSRAKLRYVLGEPIAPLLLPGESEDAGLRRVRREVEGALHELFERELASRAGIAL